MIAWLTVVLISLFESRILVFLHAGSVPFLSRIVNDVLNGTVFIPPFQSRLLGPLVIKQLETAGIRPENAYIIFIVSMVFITNITAFLLFKRVTGDTTLSARQTAYFAAAFTAFQDYRFLYSWDLISLLVFTLLAYGIFTRARTRFFVVLFLAALLNREDAILIAFWLIIDSFVYAREAILKVRLKHPVNALLGALLAGFGLFYVKYIRSALSADKDASANILMGNQFELFISLKRLFYENLFNLNIVVTLFVALAFLCFYRNRDKLTGHNAKIAAFVFIMFAFTLTFGVLNETRVWFPFIPFLLMFNLDFNHNAFRARPA